LLAVAVATLSVVAISRPSSTPTSVVIVPEQDQPQAREFVANPSNPQDDAAMRADLQRERDRIARGEPRRDGWDGGPDKLPNCIPVDSHTETDVGCVLKSDLFYDPDERHIAEPGIPVYRAEGGEIVGYLSNDSGGFVPKQRAP
jgi:hypothetical protein